MSYDTAIAPSLFDLLARSWTLPGAVEQLCFNHDGTAVAFAADGRLAIVPIADPERPETRVRVSVDVGRSTILPRKSPIRPPVIVEGVTGTVSPYGGKSFVAGSPRGGLVSVTPRGQALPLAPAAGRSVTALARDPASAAIAFASGAEVTLLPDDADASPQRFAAPQVVRALAYAPHGRSLAVAHDGGLAFWADGALSASLALHAQPCCLSWNPEGAFIACGFRTPGFALIRAADLTVDRVGDYPTPVRTFGWSLAAGAFATSGAFRTVVWSPTPSGRGAPVEAGRSSPAPALHRSARRP